MTLTDQQRSSLKALVRNSEAWASLDHPVLAYLGEHGLADWEDLVGVDFVRWFPTDAGRAELEQGGP